MVADSQRGRGYGSEFLRALEQETVQAGYQQLYLAVEPSDNPRAHVLYQRLGYQQLQVEPYLKVWELRDSGGNKHHGAQWVVDMVKQL